MLIRFSLAMFASLLTCATLVAADEPKAKTDTGETPSAESSALADEVEAITKGLADHQKKMAAAQMSSMMFQRTAQKKLLDLIKENPDDPAVIDAIAILVADLRTPMNSEFMAKIMKSPKSGELCLKLAQPGKEAFLKQVAEKHENADVRGMATFALGYANYISARMNQADEAKRTSFMAEAEKYFAKVKADHKSIADAKFQGSTVGEKAINTLNRIQNGPNIKEGKMAPEIEGVDIDGNPMKLSDSRGKVTVLIFWGSWCGPCMGLVPHEKELFARMKGKPFEMVAVNCGDSKDRAQGTRKEKDMGWRCWWDGGQKDGPIQATYNVTHYPNIFVIDAKGVIRNIDVRHKALDEAVDKLIEELGANKVSQR
jgi:thiol-disulfide isomerase/thioredoxin